MKISKSNNGKKEHYELTLKNSEVKELLNHGLRGLWSPYTSDCTRFALFFHDGPTGKSFKPMSDGKGYHLYVGLSRKDIESGRDLGDVLNSIGEVPIERYCLILDDTEPVNLGCVSFKVKEEY